MYGRGELSQDSGAALAVAARVAPRPLTASLLTTPLGWTIARADRVLAGLVKDGLVWVDDAGGGERGYYAPAHFL